MSTSAGKARIRFMRRLWLPLLWLSLLLLLPLSLIVLWNTALLPTAVVHYSKGAERELRYVWNVRDRIYRARLPPGGAASDHGRLFPDKDFFMEFSWAVEKERWHCISITPKWPNTHIYLDADGNVDRREGSGTDIDKLKECQWDWAKP